MLYPLKFKPLFKERIWGGRKMESVFDKKLPKDKPIGESWELSGVEGDVSIISNGNLSGNSLQELIEVYMGELVGEKVFERYGEEFPILIKIIDASDVLSIQVHPDDKLAAERHGAYGKTEMWYIIDNDADAELYVGFNKKYSKEDYIKHLEAGTLADMLGRKMVKPGNAYFIPAGTIHAIGKGIMIAEIQQTSDITYRVFDWNRVDSEGNGRELHTELALDAIDFGSPKDYNVTVEPKKNDAVCMQKCDYFTSNVLDIDVEIYRDYMELDSFVIYMCLEGDVTVKWADGVDKISKGETMLVPASITDITISGKGKVIEVYL